MQCAWLLCFCVRILACLYLRKDSGFVFVYLCKGGFALERDDAETEQGLSGGAVDDWGRQTRTEKLYFCVLQYT